MERKRRPGQTGRHTFAQRDEAVTTPNAQWAFVEANLGAAFLRPAAHEVDDQKDERDHQEDMDQPARDVEDEAAKKPGNEQDDERDQEPGPEHGALLLAFPAAAISGRGARGTALRPRSGVSNLRDGTPAL